MTKQNNQRTSMLLNMLFDGLLDIIRPAVLALDFIPPPVFIDEPPANRRFPSSSSSSATSFAYQYDLGLGGAFGTRSGLGEGVTALKIGPGPGVGERVVRGRERRGMDSGEG